MPSPGSQNVPVPVPLGPPVPLGGGGQSTGHGATGSWEDTYGPIDPNAPELPPAGTGPIGTGAGMTLDPTANDADVETWIRNNYGDFSWLYDIPGIKDLVVLAAKSGWGDDEVLSALHRTDYWRHTEKSAREWKQRIAIDPAQAQEEIRLQADTFRRQAKELGITIPDADITRLAEQSLQFAWTQEETQAALGKFFAPTSTSTGAANQVATELRQLHKAYLVPIANSTLDNWTAQVVSGSATTRDFEDYLRNQAKSLFPTLAGQIDLGIRPDDWASPYRQIAANELNISPDSIDFRDPKWMRALDTIDPKTGSRLPMTLTDWTSLVKTDDQYGWDQTEGGRAHGAKLATSLSQLFGRA